MSEHPTGHDVLDQINRLDVEEIMGEDLESATRQWAALEDANRVLAMIRGDLARRIGDELPEKQWTIEGLGTVERHYRKSRTEWRKDELLRDVLDVRIVDEQTGELRFATPLEKVLYVWNLPAPRTTALRELGLDPDDYCHAEPGGVNLQLHRTEGLY